MSIKLGVHTCPWWLLFTFDNPFRKLIHNPEKILGAYVEPGDTVLDIGCGMGFFSLGLAKLVGNNGKVIAVDIQEQMLVGLQKRAERAGLLESIQVQQSTPGQIGVQEPVDFALAFWMVHEVHQPKEFMEQIYELLKPGREFLIVEPRIHVTGRAFERTVILAKSVGFRAADQPKVRASRAELLCK